MSTIVLSIVEVSINKIARSIVNFVGKDDWATERAIIASNENSIKFIISYLKIVLFAFGYCKVFNVQTSGLLEDRVPMKVVLKFIIMENGAPFVMTTSMLQQMERSFAGSWGMHHCKCSFMPLTTNLKYLLEKNN